MSNKFDTRVTHARGGMHSVTRFRVAEKMILNNKYKKARLYHLVLKGAKINGVRVILTQKDFRNAVDGIVRLLRNKGIDCTGKGCFEVHPVRGLHFHFMVLVEAEYGKVDYWINKDEDGALKTMLRKFKVAIHIAEPENLMHLQANGNMPLYQYVSKTGPKLADAIERISYLYKMDSKVLDMKGIYYSTRDKTLNAAAD